MNRSLIDTDILSYLLKGNVLVRHHFENYLQQFSKITISEITYYEILSGLTFKRATRQIVEFEEFISTCEVLKLSTHSLRISAKVYAELREQGVTIGTADLLIAGVAMANNLMLITNNQRHYHPISELITSNWNV